MFYLLSFYFHELWLCLKPHILESSADESLNTCFYSRNWNCPALHLPWQLCGKCLIRWNLYVLSCKFIGRWCPNSSSWWVKLTMKPFPIGFHKLQLDILYCLLSSDHYDRLVQSNSWSCMWRHIIFWLHNCQCQEFQPIGCAVMLRTFEDVEANTTTKETIAASLTCGTLRSFKTCWFYSICQWVDIGEKPCSSKGCKRDNIWSRYTGSLEFQIQNKWKSGTQPRNQGGMQTQPIKCKSYWIMANWAIGLPHFKIKVCCSILP